MQKDLSVTELSIGILAHNEAGVIADFIRELRAQTVFCTEAGPDISICLVANGCSDDTVGIARRSFAMAKFPAYVRIRVVTLPVASKTNAWNGFFQGYLPQKTKYVVMVDPDIRLPQTNLFERCMRELDMRSDLIVASDISRKDFRNASPFNLARVASIAMQRRTAHRPSICGQFYCGRAAFLRRIALPIGLLSQDGFLRAMILTEGLTRPEDTKRIDALQDALHLHPGYSRFTSIFRYQKRQAIGTAMFLAVYKELEKMPPDFDARMEEIRRRNLARPGWVQEALAARIATNQPLMPGYARRSLKRGGSRLKRLVRLPLTATAVIVDSIIVRAAERELRAKAIGTLHANTGRFTVREDV